MKTQFSKAILNETHLIWTMADSKLWVQFQGKRFYLFQFATAGNMQPDCLDFSPKYKLNQSI